MSANLQLPESGIRQRSSATQTTDDEKSESTQLKRRRPFSPRRVSIFLCKLSALLVFGWFMMPVIQIMLFILYIFYRILAAYLVYHLSRLACSMREGVICTKGTNFMMWYLFPRVVLA